MAQFLHWVSGFDPHADPHGERSGRKQWKQEGQRALISEQKVLKTSKNRYFYSFSSVRNQQVAGSSPATSSTKPVKIVRFSPVFSFICSVFSGSKKCLTHTVTHTAKCPESGGEDDRVILFAALCFLTACSHHLCHEITHLFGGALLHLPRDVGVGAKRESRVEVSEHTGYRFYVHAVL